MTSDTEKTRLNGLRRLAREHGYKITKSPTFGGGFFLVTHIAGKYDPCDVGNIGGLESYLKMIVERDRPDGRRRAEKRLGTKMTVESGKQRYGGMGLPRKVKEGESICHNPVRPVTADQGGGFNGFRWWRCDPTWLKDKPQFHVCKCGWAPHIGNHYSNLKYDHLPLDASGVGKVAVSPE
ncbi:MAG TPA: hypothetical protein VLV76_09955 [Candidatus Acidoferrum sp.]|nr:hypothetical protein [Candidatus Acidoferrum sp.]